MRMEKERKSIYVTDLGACPKKIQFRETWYLQEDLQHFETYKGSFVHKLFEIIGKKASIEPNRNYWMELWQEQVSIPPMFRGVLERELPEYERRIKEFFTRNKVGKELFRANISRIEEAMRIPIEDLNWNLQTPDDIQKKYRLSGRPDYRFKNLIIEVKSGKTIRPEHRLQAMAYTRLADVYESTLHHGYRVLCLGGDKPTLEKLSYVRKLFQKKRQRDLNNMLDEAIELREKLEKDPFAKIMPKRDPGECAFCKYHTYCMTWKVTWRRNQI